MFGDPKIIPLDLLDMRLNIKTPVGRITECLERWIEIGATNSILRGLAMGFPIKLIAPVVQNQLYSPNFNKIEEKWIDEKIEDYLLRGNLVIAEGKVRLISNFFLVPKPGIKLFRLVVDLRPLNTISRMIKRIRLETLENFLPFLRKGDLLCTLDLKDFYLHFLIRMKDRDLVAIEWKGRILMFTTLTFGWKESPYLATKIMRIVISYLRSQGFLLSNYLDDLICVVANIKETDYLQRGQTKINNLVNIIRSLGLEIQDSKSQLQPLHSVLYLGLIIDTLKMMVLVPKKKLRDLYKMMAISLKEEFLSRRFLAKIAGKLNSISLGFIPARWCARPFHDCVGRLMDKNQMNFHFWKEKVLVTEEVKKVAEFFLKNAKHWNGKTFQTDEVFVILETDSSKNQFGAVLNSEEIIQDFWSEQEMEKHINWKELKVVLIAIQKWINILKDKKIVIKIDNRVAYYYLKKAGGKIEELNFLTREIHWICFHNNIQIQQVIWVPTEENYLPDLLSRGMDVIDWELSQEVFLMIEKKFCCKMEVDRFASDQNTKLQRFNALNRITGKFAEAIDCFSQNWKGVMNWVNPPFNLIPRVLRFIKNQQADTIMLILLEKSNLVQRSDGIKEGDDRTRIVTAELLFKEDRCNSRTSKESKMEIFGIKDKLLKESWLTIRQSWAESTKKLYYKVWEKFVLFAEMEDLEIYPAEDSTILKFMMSLSKTAPSSVKTFVTVYSILCSFNNWINPRLNEAIKRLEKAIEKRRKKRKKVEPFPLKILKHHWENIIKRDYLNWLRDGLIVALCVRTTWRAETVAEIRVKNVQFKDINNERFVIIDIFKSKTNQTGEMFRYFIDPSKEKEYCIVDLLQKYLVKKFGENWQDKNDLLFTENGNKLNSTIITEIIKKMADRAEEKIKLSSSSLRSGAVVWMLEAGLSIENLKALGWKETSTAYNCYIRNSAIAMQGGSNKMYNLK